MNATDVKQIIVSEKLVPILRTSASDCVMDIAGAIRDASCKVFEFTMTIDGILKNLGKVKDKYPELVIGLGTVYQASDAKEAIKNGADFIVSPILNFEIVEVVKSAGKMLMLSGFTPTEIYNAYIAGSDIVKLFPASEMAPNFIHELRGPMPFVDIFPTGGLTLISAIEFLSKGAVAVGLGNAIFREELIRKKNYSEITEILKNALYRIKNMAI